MQWLAWWLVSEHFLANHRYYYNLPQDSAYLSICLCFICLCTLQLPSHPSPQSLCHPVWDRVSFSVSLGITFQFGLTVPWQFMFFICKSLNKSGEEKETDSAEFVFQTSNPCSMSWHSCVNCSHYSTCTFLSLPKHTDMFYVYMPQNSRACSFWPQTVCVSLALSLSKTFIIFHNLS
jgi:hypothetical protein